jgi:hypothetical protein
MKGETAPTSQREKTIWSSILSIVTGIVSGSSARLVAGLGWAVSSVVGIGAVIFSGLLSFFCFF